MSHEKNKMETIDPGNTFHRLGIDIGSTTAKMVILDPENAPVFFDYQRHQVKIYDTLTEILSKAEMKFGNQPLSVAITGSAGMGLAEKAAIPFIQEVIASVEAVQKLYAGVRTFIDIGGEDSKMVFFDKHLRPDIRMNGSCAGGTGAFIDQMAALINIPVSAISELAETHRHIYTIASRCGVFAKTDIQNLLSRDVSKADIAASIFHAVAIQTLNTLARGFHIVPKVLFSGGPLAFLPALRKSFIKVLGVHESETILPAHPELIPAVGAAIANTGNRLILTLKEVMGRIRREPQSPKKASRRISPLFENQEARTSWERQRFFPAVKANIPKTRIIDAFIGIDSGSTTSKMVLIDSQGNILLDYYVINKGDHLASVRSGLAYFADQLKQNGARVRIRNSVVTGYGEDLVKTAFNIDIGVVETIAHLKAARHFNPDVSFILDIGGQDMKAIFIENGAIKRIEINEACSSGCGSFIQNFAQTLGFSMEAFAQTACSAEKPCDLGSRCTVFMNSKVKQFLREGTSVRDLAAGLAYSVIKNSLTKVLKVKDISVLGDHIMIQGGAFENPAIHRAFEILTGKSITCPSIMKLMGAYGAALIARETHEVNHTPKSTFIGFDHIDRVIENTKTYLNCKGCENRCKITKIRFDSQKVFYTGNKCENVFTNRGEKWRKGFNFASYKKNLLFDRKMQPDNEPLLTVGIPRVLNIWENFPFWNTLLVNAGVQVKLSDWSQIRLYELGRGTIMSDNICFPAKLTHGHIIDLVEQQVDRIFYPIVVYETVEKESANSYNCPIVTGYPDVIDSAINPKTGYHIPLDRPTVNFADIRLLKKSCFQYLSGLGIKKKVIHRAFNLAITAQKDFKRHLTEKSEAIVTRAGKENRKVINLVGRPYHCDALINHKIPEIISDFGIDFIMGDTVPQNESFKDIRVLTQWSYTNRLYHQAQFCVENPHVEMVLLNSFGCGPDTIAVDEVDEILRSGGKPLTRLRIDEVSSPGSIRLRLRTMIESMKIQKTAGSTTSRQREDLPAFQKADQSRRILVPYFADIYSDFMVTAFKAQGINAELLPPSNHRSLDLGLKYTNNEVCFPGIIVVGDIIKALLSGKYDHKEICVGISQTGGPCRASNYLSLIKKAMIHAGFGDIPIVSISTRGQSMYHQPGFQFDKTSFYKSAILAILFGDALSMMRQRTMVRAKEPAAVDALVRKYVAMVQWGIAANDIDYIINLLEKAVAAFNRLEVKPDNFPRIGVVGEIFVKYSRYANHDVVNWLTENNIEVSIPPLIDFFIQELVNTRANISAFINRRDLSWLFSYDIERRLNRVIRRITGVLKNFRFYQPFHSIHAMAKNAQRAINLTNQFGEGWLITAEMMMFAEDGIENILCLQPFGCISNQVIAKGVEKRLKDLYPGLNILFFDLDQDTSEANFMNRLHFLMRNAKASAGMKN